MNRISCLYIFSLFVMCVFAQQPNYNKMSPLVREAATDVIQQRRQAPSIYPEQYQPTITAFAKFSGNADGLIKKYSCRQLAKVDNVYILSIPLNQLAGLSNEKKRITNRGWQWK